VLVLPSEAAEAAAAPRFEDRNEIRRTANSDRLCIADRQQRRTGDRFDESVAQRVGGDAERTPALGY